MVWPGRAALLPLALASVTAAPAHWPYHWQQQGRVAVTEAGGAGDVATGRIFWGPLGDAIQATGWFPWTVNVPDVMSAMWSYMSGWLYGDGGGGGGTADTGSRPEKTKKKKKKQRQKEDLTRADLVDYFIYR